MAGIRFRSARRSRGVVRYLIAAISWCLQSVRHAAKLLDPSPLFRKWQHRRYGNRYTVDRNGSAIYRPAVWSCFQEYIGKDTHSKRKLLEWAQKEIPEFKIPDFGSCWSDGIALCALLEAQCPGACPRYDLLRPSHKINNCRLALKTAYKYLSIPLNIISAEDLATFSTRYQDTIQKLISLIKWASLQKAIKDATKDDDSEADPDLEKQTQQDATLIKSCFASGCGLAVGLVGRHCRFDVHVPVTELLDLFVAIRGPSGSTSHEQITVLFPKQRTSSVERVVRDRRAIALWKFGASKVLTARGRRAVISKKFDYPSISEEPKISIEYQIVKEGHISISYMPQRKGAHAMVLKWHDRQFLDSPYQIRISDTIDNLNKTDQPATCMQQLRFCHKLKYTPAYLSMSKYDPIDEINLKKEKTQDMNICGVAAAVLNRTSKVQRSISRIGVPASGSVPKQAVVRNRRVLKRIITTGGQEIVIQEAAPTPPQTSPENSIDVEQKVTSSLNNNNESKEGTQQQHPNGTLSNGVDSHSHNGIQLSPVGEMGRKPPSKQTSGIPACLTIPTAERTLQASPFSQKLDSPVSPDKAREMSLDSPSFDYSQLNTKTGSPAMTQTSCRMETGSFSGATKDNISNRQSRHSVSENRPMLKKSESKNRLRTSFSLPTLRRTWNAFDIDDDDTLSPSEMEALSIAAQKRQKRATLSVVELNNIVNDFSTAMNDSKYITDALEQKSENVVEIIALEDVSNEGRDSNISKPQQEHISEGTAEPEKNECLLKNLSRNVKLPKATHDKWTQVNYETITAETGWKRPTTYVRPRRRAIYAKRNNTPDAISRCNIQTSISETHDDDMTSQAQTREQIDNGHIMTIERNVQISLPEEQVNGTENSSSETTEEGASTHPRRPTRFPTPLTRPKVINGHRALRRFLYRGKIALDPKLTSNIPRTPTPVEDKGAFSIPRRRRLRSLNSRSSSEGRRSNVHSSREETPEVELRYLPRLRRNNFFRKKVKFSKRVLIHKQSSSRSSRNSKQSNEDTTTPTIARQFEGQPLEDRLQLERASQETQTETYQLAKEQIQTRQDFEPATQFNQPTSSCLVPSKSTAELDSGAEATSRDSLTEHTSSKTEHISKMTTFRSRILPSPYTGGENSIPGRISRSISCPTQLLDMNTRVNSISFLPIQEGSSRVAKYIQDLAEDDKQEATEGVMKEPRPSKAASSDADPPTANVKHSHLHKLLSIGTSINRAFSSDQEEEQQFVDNFAGYGLEPVQETPQVPDPFRCRAFGPGLSHGVVGGKNMFQVSAPTTSNGSLSVSVTGPRPRTVRETSVLYTGDDLYEVTFEGSRPGVYLLHVRWGDFNIPDSPFVCQMDF